MWRTFGVLVALATTTTLPLASTRGSQTDGLAQIRTVDASTPQDVQIALAEAAGPPVGKSATIFVLAAKGYVQVREGTNGFACLVSREFRNTVEPECYDAEGVATVLPVWMFREAQRAAGVDEATIDAQIESRYKSGQFIAPRKPGLVYMLSDNNYVFDPSRKEVIHFPGHLMFYAPYATEKEVGVGPGAPYIVAPGTPQALMIVIPASTHEHG
jgi:hypothetical protein